MRQVLPFGVAVLAAALTIALCRVDAGAEFRAAGMTLLDQAETAGKAGDDAFTGAALPAPVATTLAAVRWFGEDPLSAATVGAALITGLTAAAVTLTGWSLGGLVGALGALATLLLLPGTLYHGRTVGPEATIALSWSLLALAGTVGARGPVGALLGSLAMLAALASSHESAWLLIAWLVAAWLVRPRRATARHAGEVPLSPVPVAWLVPALAGPALLFALWPHLGEDAGKRLIAVIYDPLKAQHVPLLIAGQIHDQATARGPGVADGWLLLLVRLPAVLAALAGLGAAAVVRGIARGEAAPRRGAFALLAAATLVLIIGLNGSPWYAGVDGVATLGPLLAVLAGLGVAALWQAVRSLWPARFPGSPAVGATLVAALSLGPAAVERAHSFGLEPAYHSALIGGVQGAAALGFEPRPLPALSEGLITWMNRSLPQKAALAVDPAGDRYRSLVDALKRRGILRADLESASPYHATHVLMPTHPAYPLYGDAAARSGAALVTWENDGAVLMTLYRY